MDTAKIYGLSLYNLAKEEGTEKEILSQLSSISQLFGEYPDYVKILDSPQLSHHELTQIISDDFSERINRYTLNFLKLLSEKHIVHCIDECFKEYEKRYNYDNNVTIVNVTTARSLSDGIIRKLTEKLEKKTGGKVLLKQKLDEGCIGGIIIEAEGIRVDASIKNELEKMKRLITN